MTNLATYPKFSSIAFIVFELQRKGAKMNLNFHSNPRVKTMVMIHKKL
jgi:hypothetical protein